MDASVVIVIVEVIISSIGRDVERYFDAGVSQGVLSSGADDLGHKFKGSLVAIYGEFGEAFDEGGVHFEAAEVDVLIEVDTKRSAASLVKLMLRETHQGADLFF